MKSMKLIIFVLIIALAGLGNTQCVNETGPAEEPEEMKIASDPTPQPTLPATPALVENTSVNTGGSETPDGISVRFEGKVEEHNYFTYYFTILNNSYIDVFPFLNRDGRLINGYENVINGVRFYFDYFETETRSVSYKVNAGDSKQFLIAVNKSYVKNIDMDELSFTLTFRTSNRGGDLISIINVVINNQEPGVTFKPPSP